MLLKHCYLVWEIYKPTFKTMNLLNKSIKNYFLLFGGLLTLLPPEVLPSFLLGQLGLGYLVFCLELLVFY